MGLPIPTKLEKNLITALDRLVADGLYQSRSEAIRDSVRRLAERSYLSKVSFLRVIAEITAHVILEEYPQTIADIILYGSVASGQASEYSDIDILVLISRSKDNETLGQVETRIHEISYPIALTSQSVITPIVLERRRFLDLCRSRDHFAREIVEHGVPLHGMILDELRKQTVPAKG